MDKKKIFAFLYEAKDSNKEIWIGFLANSSKPYEYKRIFEIKYDYKFEFGYLGVTQFDRNSKESKVVREQIEFPTILNVEKYEDSVLVVVYEDRA